MKLSERCDLRDEGYTDGYRDGLAARDAECKELVEALEFYMGWHKEGRVQYDVHMELVKALRKFKGGGE